MRRLLRPARCDHHGDKTLRQVIDELLAVKKSAGMSERYLKDLRIRLNIFAQRFGSEKAINVSQQMVDDWIIALPYSGTTKNNYRRLLGVLFSFAVDRKYVLQIPISKQSKFSVKRGKPGILTVERMCSTPFRLWRRNSPSGRPGDVCRSSS